MTGRTIQTIIVCILLVTSVVGVVAAAPDTQAQHAIRQPQEDQYADTLFAAEQVAPNETYTGKLGSQSDVDYLRVPVLQGDTITLTLEKQPNTDVIAHLAWPGHFDVMRNKTGENITRTLTAETNGAVIIGIGSLSNTTTTQTPAAAMETAMEPHIQQLSTSEATLDVQPAAIQPDPTPDISNWALSINRTPHGDGWSALPQLNDPIDLNTSYNGTIDTPEDIDTPPFRVQADDVLEIAVTKPSGADIQPDVLFPSGTEDIISKNKSAQVISSRFIVETNGTAAVELSSTTMQEVPENWSLTVTRLPHEDKWRQNSRHADPVSPDGTYSGRLDTAEDWDSFRIPVSAGDALTLQYNLSEGIDMRVDSPNTSFRANATSTMTTRTINATEDGYVHISVRNFGELIGGEWTIEVSRQAE